MVQALAAAGGSLLGALTNQSRREVSRGEYIPQLPALAAADKQSLSKLRKEADKERLYQFLAQPEIVGFLMAFAGLIASNRIPFSDDEEKNAVLQAIASTMSVAMGMGYAGVGDLTSLSVAIAAGGGSLLGGLIDLPGGGTGGEWWKYLNPLTYLISTVT